jgi:hypothetical protein
MTLRVPATYPAPTGGYIVPLHESLAYFAVIAALHDEHAAWDGVIEVAHAWPSLRYSTRAAIRDLVRRALGPDLIGGDESSDPRVRGLARLIIHANACRLDDETPHWRDAA